MARLRVPVQLRWSDVDGYAHVNNVAMLTLLEESRIEAFWASPPSVDDSGRGNRPTAIIDAGPGADTSTLVARQQIEYLVPLAYRRAPVIVEMWLGHLGGASMDVCYEVKDSGDDATVYARAETTVVLVDAATGRPRRLGDAERAAWAPYVEEPVSFRHRGR